MVSGGGRSLLLLFWPHTAMSVLSLIRTLPSLLKSSKAMPIACWRTEGISYLPSHWIVSGMSLLVERKKGSYFCAPHYFRWIGQRASLLMVFSARDLWCSRSFQSHQKVGALPKMLHGDPVSSVGEHSCLPDTMAMWGSPPTGIISSTSDNLRGWILGIAYSKVWHSWDGPQMDMTFQTGAPHGCPLTMPLEKPGRSCELTTAQMDMGCWHIIRNWAIVHVQLHCDFELGESRGGWEASSCFPWSMGNLDSSQFGQFLCHS